MTPRVSILIPCFNEAARIERTLPRVLEYLDRAGLDAEVIPIDDGSTDTTGRVLESSAQGDERVCPVRLPRNRGKGGALIAGVDKAGGEVILFFDADLSYRLANIERALSHLDEGCQVVIGARDLSRSAGGYSLMRRAASLAFNGLVDLFLDLDIPDTQCGFKAFEASTAKALFDCLTIERFGFDVELLFLARRWGLKIERMPIEMVHQTGSSVRLLRDSVRMFADIARIWTNARRGRYPEDRSTSCTQFPAQA